MNIIINNVKFGKTSTRIICFICDFLNIIGIYFIFKFCSFNVEYKQNKKYYGSYGKLVEMKKLSI